MHVPLGPGAEFDRIRRFLASARTGDPKYVRVGPGDDAAIIEAGRLAISTDMSVENVHFRREWLTPPEIGARATMVALSDQAACAALPFGVLVSLAVAADEPADMMASIMDGVRAAAEGQGAVLIGGDLTRSPGPIVIDVITLGSVERAVLRSGARTGDTVWVTGRLGAAAAAVSDLGRGRTPDAGARVAYASPMARTREARWLAEHELPTAMIDLSDGLASDAAHIAAASGRRIVIEAAELPVHDVAASRGSEEGFRLALAGGDDYELCFTAPAGAVEDARSDFQAAFAVPLTRVGTVEEGRGVMLRESGGELVPMPVAGFDHFARGQA